VELVHGPGCPVCVTPLEMVDHAIRIAARPEAIFVSYGDMLRVPGSASDIKTAVQAGDARPVIVKDFLKIHRSPLEPYAEDIVTASDQYGFDYRLLPAIAMAESGAGKEIEYNSIKFISTEHHVSGELDCVVKFPEDNHPTVIEVKTYWGYQATKDLVGNPRKGIPGKPKDQNLLQILTYLYLHQDLFPKGKIVYLDKTCQENIEFDIQLAIADGKTYPVINGVISRRFAVEDIFDRYKSLKEHIDNKQLLIIKTFTNDLLGEGFNGVLIVDLKNNSVNRIEIERKDYSPEENERIELEVEKLFQENITIHTKS